MRLITQLAMAAFNSNVQYFNKDNTKVLSIDMGEGVSKTCLYLHHNLIAVKTITNGVETLEITTAAWNTPTTKERLNGLNGISVYHKKRQMYLNGKPWDGSLVDVNKWDEGLKQPIL